MSHLHLAPDGASLLVADAFGVTRVAFGKAVKVKHTPKVGAPTGDLSVNAAGSLCLVDGRVHTGAYGHRAVAVLGLPALAIKHKLGAHATPFALTTTPAGDHALTLSHGGKLQVLQLLGDSLMEARALPLGPRTARSLAPMAAGPQSDAKHYTPRLHATAEGTFVARTGDGMVYAGRLGPDDDGDAVWWALPLATHSSAEVTFAAVCDTVWVFVRDAAAEEVYALRIDRAGDVHTAVWPSLCAPAVDGVTALTQPDSHTVLSRSLADGAARSYPVEAFNAHPAEAPEASAFPRGRPPAPTRLPGRVAVQGARRVFVPWHGETVVDLDAGVAHGRGLEVPAGPFRRLLLESFLRLNDSLRELGVEAHLGACERHPKAPRYGLVLVLPMLAPTFGALVAQNLAHTLWTRCEFATHDHRWSGMSHEGGYARLEAPTPLNALRPVLAWMQRHGWPPHDVAQEMVRRYQEGMGIPHTARPEALPFEPPAARLFVRAMLATLASGAWPADADLDAWSAAPVTAEEARAAVGGLASLAVFLNSDIGNLLTKCLAEHLGADALPALFALLERACAEPEAGRSAALNLARAAGEAIAWVVAAHPEHRDATLTALDATRARFPAAAASVHDTLVETHARVSRGAPHFWSNV